MDSQDYNAGYRGHQFHHGMDRGEYERGKGQKELEDTLGGAGRAATPVDGVSFTLLLVAPFIWMVYPVLGVTIMVAPAIVVLICLALKMQGLWPFFFAFILGVLSFFPGMQFEGRASQFVVYRWIRGILRIVFSFVAITGLIAGKHTHSFNDIPPGAYVGGFFGAVIAYLTFQRLDLIYFRATAEIKKMQEQLARGERPQRPILKRLFFGFCWFIPVMMILNLIINVGARLGIEDNIERKEFYEHYGAIIFGVNAVIWYALCFLGKLPGTGKYMFNARHEEDLKSL